MKKILIVEDEEVLLKLLEQKLIQEGYQVEISRNGEEGLEKLKEEKPDLILLDIMMPKMGGFEMMERINQDQSLKSIPVVIVSNSGQPVELSRAKELGVKDWLIKTDFDPQEVIEKVKKQIGPSA